LSKPEKDAGEHKKIKPKKWKKIIVFFFLLPWMIIVKVK
jgi:hypothetical protein